MIRIIFPLTGKPKPRMVRSDKWAKRPIVEAYFAWCNAMKLIANKEQYVPQEELELIFNMPMPISWSKKKRLEMLGKPHKVRPDLSNLTKSFEDALAKEDSYIWKYRTMQKIWAEKGSIVVYERNKQTRTDLP